jgi:biopolymer transport protein ExbB
LEKKEFPLGGSQYDLLTLFADGGAMMYPLVLCSLIALGVIIAKVWTLWMAHKDTKSVLAQVEEAARAGRIDEAIQIASETTGPAAAILLSGLKRIRSSRVAEGELEQAVSTTGAIELGFLERGLVVLATVANVAPLMGFLGTVVGMILAFAAIETAGSVDPTLVAGGIKVALLTTATGLTIAIPVNIGYNYFVTRIDGLILGMEQGTQQILNLAWDREKEGMLTVVRKERLRRTLSGVGSSSSAVARGAVSAPPPPAPELQTPVEPEESPGDE